VLIERGAADIFLAYCTGARAALNESPGQQVIALPDPLAVGAVTVITGAPPSAYKFALFILSPEGQRMLERHGFAAPNLP